MIPEPYETLFTNPANHPQADFLKKAVQYLHLADLQGDYLEFGVFQGETLSIAYHFAQRDNTKHSQRNMLANMHFYAFDSFQGLPKPSGKDLEGFLSEDFHRANYCCNENTFRANLGRNNVDLEKVTVVPGWFHETLTPQTKELIPLQRAALTFIDCDLYESTVPVLDFLTDYLCDGSIIAFDDWYACRGHPNRGEQRAFREWRQKQSELTFSEFQKFGWHGNSFIVHR